ncbi:23S rRNA (adenine(2503)-C(2))-methyltransferase RlmN, partial [bacterium]|nr:23S rRNA (adenine(2503)-C(2))-methyltransferase RlmN [bacterium]
MNAIKPLKEYNQEELQELVKSWGEKPFHGKQIFAALFRRGIKSIDEMTDLSLNLRGLLADYFPLDLLEPVELQRATDKAAKVLFRLRDGEFIESVWMPEVSHAVQCLSTQVGCPLDCSFCATGKMGFVRNLTRGEIVDQILVFRREHNDPPLRNVVFMG